MYLIPLFHQYKEKPLLLIYPRDEKALIPWYHSYSSDTKSNALIHSITGTPGISYPPLSFTTFLSHSRTQFFRNPAPKLPSIFAFPDRLPAYGQSSLKVQKMYSSSSQPFLYSMEQVSLSAACSISRSSDFSGRSYII